MTALWLLTASAAPLVYAGWLDKVAERVAEFTGSPPSAVVVPQLVPAAAADYQLPFDPQDKKAQAWAQQHVLPAHWRAYWLNEPVFNQRIFLAETGDKSKPVVLLVHGLGQNGLRDWLKVAPALAADYRVVMLDLPGFGLSPAPQAKLNPTRYAALLHYVKPLFSEAPVAVVGHSMGTAVTLRYADLFPADVKQIVLLDAAGILQRTAFVKHSASDRIDVDQEGMPSALLRFAVGAKDLSNSVIENIVRLPDPTVLLGKSDFAWGKVLGKSPNLNAALGLIDEDFSHAIYRYRQAVNLKPVAILWGEQDAIAPLRTGQVLAANIPHAVFTVIPEAGHMVLKTHAEQVNPWLRAQLQMDWVGVFSSISSVGYDAAVQQEWPSAQCDHDAGRVFSGRYRTLRLKACAGARLNAVMVEQLIVEDSVVTLDDVVVEQQITLKDSVAVMTAGELQGEVILDHARLDMAGVWLREDSPFRVLEDSRVIASVCRIGDKGYWHGDQKMLKP